MLFYIYIGTTAFVWVDTFAHQIYLDRRLKKEGYKYTGNKYFGLADVVLGFFYLGALSIPVINLVFPLSHLNKDRSYDEYKNYLDDAGAIELDEEKIKVDPKLTKELENINNNDLSKNSVTINDTVLMERVNQNGHTYYSPMNRFDTENTVDYLNEEKGHVYKKDFFKRRHK